MTLTARSIRSAAHHLVRAQHRLHSTTNTTAKTLTIPDLSRFDKMPSKEIKATDFPLLQTCLTDNKEWAEKVHVDDPDFFRRSAKGQSPFLLWIGCGYLLLRDLEWMVALTGFCLLFLLFSLSASLPDNPAFSLRSIALLNHRSLRSLYVLDHSLSRSARSLGCGESLTHSLRSFIRTLPQAPTPVSPNPSSSAVNPERSLSTETSPTSSTTTTIVQTPC